jgi:BirA family transcriptional regulator, biotin operon repressor / biotin---[acetyl-CoA-carboxylase] ligase
MTSLSNSMGDAPLSPADLDRIVAETFIDRVDYRPEFGSTNSRALELAADSPDGTSTLVLADRQTDGRGRGTNRWWSAEGALSFSVLLKPNLVDLPTSRWPQASLTAGLAVCDAIESLVDDVTLSLKWPNDVFLAGRKLCGILVEATDGVQRSLVVGIGVNVNNSVFAAPADIRDKAIALCDFATSPTRRIDVLVAILQCLAARLERLSSGRLSTGIDVLRRDWRSRCLLTGRKVHLELPLRRVVGICRGIDDDGALMLETDAGLERCVSGVIVKFE